MLRAVDKFPDHFRYPSNTESDATKRGPRVRNVVIMGMGGSASAGDVVLDWVRDEMMIPALVHRDPHIPRWVDSKTQFVAISYSGNTLETLAGFREARKRKARLIGIGNGGELEELCHRYDAEYFKVEEALAPRAALGQMIVATGSALASVRLIQSMSTELHTVGKRLRRLRNSLRKESPKERNPAKQFATQLHGSFPSLYSLQRMASVARRFKNQLAENSKTLSKYDLIPESCHNEVEAWRKPRKTDLPVIVRDMIESAFEKSAIQAFSKTISLRSSLKPLQVRMRGADRLS
ncbi:MAG TPA: SIS domain-containing protein, partial [Candidatus Bathyarchaeia archaeon]|nr:SIS domain-containing protein [Candidatus Bathyarchaeia archaeon]